MFAPRIAVEDARGDRARLASMLKRVTYWNLAVSLPIFMCLLVLASALLDLFGTAYGAGATALAILAAGQIVNAAARAGLLLRALEEYPSRSDGFRHHDARVPGTFLLYARKA
jgi:O-antigen/teichoic acid export membrane protein